MVIHLLMWNQPCAGLSCAVEAELGVASVQHSIAFLTPTVALPSPGARELDAHGMNSHLHPKDETKYRATDWTEHNGTLCKRDVITF